MQLKLDRSSALLLLSLIGIVRLKKNVKLGNLWIFNVSLFDHLSYQKQHQKYCFSYLKQTQIHEYLSIDTRTSYIDSFTLTGEWKITTILWDFFLKRTDLTTAVKPSSSLKNVQT